jgi:hypothetical protein
MKIKFFIVLLVFSTNVALSQNYMDDIVSKACKCLTSLSDTLEPKRFNIEVGLCMIKVASPYAKQLMNDYNIDLSQIDEQVGGELGRIIAIKMAGTCPDALLKIVNKNGDNGPTENFIEGQITVILDDKFVEFSLKDAKGKTSKYYWFTFIESNIDLSNNYKKMVGQLVKIIFKSQEFFDPRIGEYRTFNIIQKLELINQ